MGDEEWNEQVAADVADRVMSLIARARVPLRTAGSIGLDGTTFQVFFREGSSTSSFEWRQSPPLGWEPLGEVVDLLRGVAARGGYV
jgi:hypothetical protein